jgi:hypothetical protein
MWRKAWSCTDSANCVEVGCVPEGSAMAGMILVRDSKDGENGPVLAFTPQEWAAFLAGVRSNEFDAPGAKG